MEWAGERVSSVCFVRRTEQGEYRYAITRENGEVFFEDVGEGQMLLIPSDACRRLAVSQDRANSLPEDDAIRGQFPMADGLLDYFPNALAEVSKVSKVGNDKHNPGQPMHHARSKSTDHRNKIMRHLIDAGGKDASGMRHSAYLAWRALALLQEELEREEGYPMARGARP